MHFLDKAGTVRRVRLPPGGELRPLPAGDRLPAHLQTIDSARPARSRRGVPPLRAREVRASEVAASRQIKARNRPDCDQRTACPPGFSVLEVGQHCRASSARKKTPMRP